VPGEDGGSRSQQIHIWGHTNRKAVPEHMDLEVYASGADIPVRSSRTKHGCWGESEGGMILGDLLIWLMYDDVVSKRGTRRSEKTI